MLTERLACEEWFPCDDVFTRKPEQLCIAGRLSNGGQIVEACYPVALDHSSGRGDEGAAK